jgi:hypothetical protein
MGETRTQKRTDRNTRKKHRRNGETKRNFEEM